MSMRDCRFEALRGFGYTGTTSDMLEQWMSANGGARGDEHGSLFRSFLMAQGVTPGHVKDMWYEFLGSLGYEGSLRDREELFWCSGGNIEPPVLRRLLTDTGEVLTNEAGEPLQHDLTTEDDMLLSDYLPTRIRGIDAYSIPENTTWTSVTYGVYTLPAGDYTILHSVDWYAQGQGSTQHVLQFRVLLDGAPLSSIVGQEPKDSDETYQTNLHEKIIGHPGGSMVLALQAQYEGGDGAPTAEIAGGNLILSRVLTEGTPLEEEEVANV